MTLNVLNRFSSAIILTVPHDHENGGPLLSHTSFAGAELANADLGYSYLLGSDFANANLDTAYMYYVRAADANFSGANLKNADLSFARLTNANFIEADVRGAHFSHARLDGVNFTGARREAGDQPIPGWKVESGLMRRRRSNECALCIATEDLAPCGNCDDHCGHTRCDACNACVDSVCDECGDCIEHACCECLRCDRGCGRLQGCSYDNDCGYCSLHCACGDEDDEDECSHGKPWFDPKPKVFKCSRTCGVEWEYNNALNLSSWRTKWRGGIHSDGSCGWEAVTAPMAGDHIKACLTDLGAAFVEKGARADDRCGIHVHVDARDMSWADMYRLLWVYGKIEPILYLLAGQKRALGGNSGRSYCSPVGQKYLASLSEIDRKGGVLAVAFEKGSPDIAKQYVRSHRMHKKDQGRYRGLNIIPWLAGRTKGDDGKHKRAPDSTVEFRMHRNSLDPKRIIGWTQLCVRIVEWCANATDKQAQALPKSALRALCEVIAPDCAPWILSRVKEWRKATKMGSSYSGKRKRSTPRYISLTKAGYALKVA